METRMSLFLRKLKPFRSATLLKRDSTTSVSCDYCEIFKTTYFEEHLRTAASVYSNDLLKYKNCVIKKHASRKGFEFIKKSIIYKAKFH